MFRKSVLITLIGTTTLGLAFKEASARDAGRFSSPANHYVPSSKPVFNPSPGSKDRGFQPGYLRRPAATLKIKPNKVTPAYVNPNAGARIPGTVHDLGGVILHPRSGRDVPAGCRSYRYCVYTPRTPRGQCTHWVTKFKCGGRV